MTGLARILVRTFFRRIEVEHAERLATGRPTVLVADHRNGLVDGLLLMATLGRYPHFLGKSTLFRNPLLWPFLHLAGVLPVHRVQDGGSPDGNAAAFAASNRVLAGGGLLAVFPEGISHDGAGLQPLRTGAARIALAAAGDGAPDVDTVAVALIYDDKQRFRSRALVRVGMPQPVASWNEPSGRAPRQAVRSLTDDLGDRIRQTGTQVSPWQDAGELAAIADIVSRTATVLPAEVALADRRHALDALAGADADGRREEAVESLRSAYRRYSHELDLTGLTDSQVAASYRSDTLRSQYLVGLAKVVAAAPPAAIGVVIHVIPYRLVKMAASIPDNRSVRSTVKLIGSFFLYLITYVVLGVLVGRTFGPLPGLLAAAAAPVCGYVAVRLAERIRRMGGARQGFRLARDEKTLLASILDHRSAVVVAADALIGSGMPTARRPAVGQAVAPPTALSPPAGRP